MCKLLEKEVKFKFEVVCHKVFQNLKKIDRGTYINFSKQGTTVQVDA